MRRRSAVVRAASCCVDWGRKTFAWVRFFAALRMTADNQEQKAKHKTKRPARKIFRAGCVDYADALMDLPLKKASRSVLMTSFRVEHMPWGAPGMTLKIAPFTIFDERFPAAAMGTI